MEKHKQPMEPGELTVMKNLIVSISRLILFVVTVLVAILVFAVFPNIFSNIQWSKQKNNFVAELPVAPMDDYWHAPSDAALANHPDRESILYGKDLVVNTTKYFGPKGIVKVNATNGLNCQNCHLDAGTKPFGNNYGSVASTYPRYRARSGAEEDIVKRVSDCFERSLNGEAPAPDSKEMLAMVDYINWLGKDVPKGEKAKGSGLKDIAFLDRPANPSKGKIAYDEKCASCHQVDGLGIENFDGTGYQYPPMWGPDSYNDGAGLYRISNFAKYALYNMPLGVSHEDPILTPEEAWDIAAYVNSQPRPKMDISKDWPNIAEKPFDHPFGPFADGFSEKQHKYGPFPPIQEKLKAMQASKPNK